LRAFAEFLFSPLEALATNSFFASLGKVTGGGTDDHQEDTKRSIRRCTRAPADVHKAEWQLRSCTVCEEPVVTAPHQKVDMVLLVQIYRAILIDYATVDAASLGQFLSRVFGAEACRSAKEQARMASDGTM